MKRKTLYICAIVCALVLLLTLPISASDDMKKIEAGTYRFNDVLTVPSNVILEDINFTCKASVEGVGELNAICSNIWVNPGDGTYSTPDVRYTVIKTTPDVGFPSTGSDVAAYWAEDSAWNETYGGEVLETITIPYDQDVSVEFYEWFAANAKVYTIISGTWIIKNIPSFDNELLEFVNFISNGKTYLAFRLHMGSTQSEIFYAYSESGADQAYIDWYYDLEGNEVLYEWSNNAYKTIEFVGEQSVSQQFVDWFTANAKPLLDNECTNYTDALYACECDVSLGSAWQGPEVYWYEDGVTTYQDTCGRCGHTVNYMVWDAHDYVDETLPASCEAGGWTAHTCSNCGDSYVGSETAALGHDFSVPTVYPATCTAAGYTLYTCSRAGCGQVWVDPDSYVAGNHDMKAIKMVHATCTEPGYIDKACSECGKTERTVLNALDHFWIQETVAPTCTEKGYTKNACARCDVYEVVQGSETSAVGHNYSAVIIDGKQYNLCANCLDRVFISDYVPGDPDGNEGDPTCAHEFITMVVPPTCGTQGYTWYECTKCEHSYQGDIKDPVSHQYELLGRIEPTCTNSGMIINTCKLCGDSISADEAYIPPLGHDYKTVSSLLDDDVIITKSECTRCHVTKTETFPTEAGQAQNWLMTCIKGLFAGFADMYDILANGIEIGGVTLGMVVTAVLIVIAILILVALAFKILG